MKQNLFFYAKNCLEYVQGELPKGSPVKLRFCDKSPRFEAIYRDHRFEFYVCPTRTHLKHVSERCIVYIPSGKPQDVYVQTDYIIKTLRGLIHEHSQN